MLTTRTIGSLPASFLGCWIMQISLWATIFSSYTTSVHDGCVDRDFPHCPLWIMPNPCSLHIGHMPGSCAPVCAWAACPACGFHFLRACTPHLPAGLHTLHLQVCFLTLCVMRYMLDFFASSFHCCESNSKCLISTSTSTRHSTSTYL